MTVLLHPNVLSLPVSGQQTYVLDDRLRRPRIATTTLFFLTGAVFATWAARIPAIQERLQLSPGALSIALVGIEAGALAGLPGGGRLVARIGSAPALRIGFALFPPALVAAATAPSLVALVAALAAMGASNSVIDVAMNAQGIELERRARRPLLSGLHSGHSFGVLAGGLAGTALAAHGVPVAVHFAAAAALALTAAQSAATALIDERPTPEDAHATAAREHGPAERPDQTGSATDPRRPAEPSRLDRGSPDPTTRPPHPATDRLRPAKPLRSNLAALGLLAFCAFFVEGAANDWSAVHARDVHHATPALAAAAFTTFSLTLALGRLAGDRLVARWGRALAIRGATLLAAAGAAAVVVAPSTGAALAGWAVLGAGVATIAPTLLGAAPSATTAAPARAIATVSMIGYAGSFSGPPAIGAAAELTNLDAALASLILGALAIAAFAPRVLASQRRRPQPDCARTPAVLRSNPANDLP